MREIPLHPRLGIGNFLRLPQAIGTPVGTHPHDHRVGKDVVELRTRLGVDLAEPVAVVHLNADRERTPAHLHGMDSIGKRREFHIVAERPLAAVVLQRAGADDPCAFTCGGELRRHAATDVKMPVGENDSAPRALFGQTLVHEGVGIVRGIAVGGGITDRMVQVKEHRVGELERLPERIAVHRAAADGGQPVRRAVEVDVAGNDPRIVVRERVPRRFRVKRIRKIGRDDERHRCLRRERLMSGEGDAEVLAAHLFKHVLLRVVEIGAGLHADVDPDGLLVQRRRVRALVRTVETVRRPQHAGKEPVRDGLFRETADRAAILQRLGDRHAGVEHGRRQGDRFRPRRAADEREDCA